MRRPPAPDEPTPRERGSQALDEVRARHPGFREALVADARLFASYRGEHFRFGSDREALRAALRLAWEADAFLGLALYRAKAALQGRGVPVLPQICHRLAMITAQVCIGDPVVVAPGIYLPHGQIVIDGFVEISKGVTIRPWVTIGLKDGVVRGPTIGSRVSIGTGAKVIGPITIGDRAKIGANAVVVHDVAAEAVVVGIPARELG